MLRWVGVGEKWQNKDYAVCICECVWYIFIGEVVGRKGALWLYFFLNHFWAFLIAGKRNFTDCCTWTFIDGANFLCLNISWVFVCLFPNFSYVCLCHDNIIGSLWECSNQVCCFGIGEISGPFISSCFSWFTLELKIDCSFFQSTLLTWKWFLVMALGYVHPPWSEVERYLLCASFCHSCLHLGFMGLHVCDLWQRYHTLFSWGMVLVGYLQPLRITKGLGS